MTRRTDSRSMPNCQPATQLSEIVCALKVEQCEFHYGFKPLANTYLLSFKFENLKSASSLPSRHHIQV